MLGSTEREKSGFEVRASLGLAAESILLRQRGRSRRFELELCDNIWHFCVACELRSKHHVQFLAQYQVGLAILKHLS